MGTSEIASIKPFGVEAGDLKSLMLQDGDQDGSKVAAMSGNQNAQSRRSPFFKGSDAARFMYFKRPNTRRKPAKLLHLSAYVGESHQGERLRGGGAALAPRQMWAGQTVIFQQFTARLF